MLVLLGWVLYGPSLLCPFLWDEYGLILDNAAKGAFEWRHLPALFSHRYFHIPGAPDLRVHLSYYRPVTVLFHALSYHAFGPVPLGYRLESLLLHVGNTVLLFLLFDAFFSRRPFGPDRSVALVTATLLFFVHPRNVESVCIIANQTGLLCSFFTLLSLLCWTRILAGSRRLALLYTASLFSLLLAMLSKESGYVVPLLAGLFFLLFRPRGRRNLAWLPAGFFLVLCVPLAARHSFLEGPSIGAGLLDVFSGQASILPHLGSVLALLLHQLNEWFFPVGIHLFQYPFSPEKMTLREAAPPVFVLGGLLWLLRRDRRLVLLGFGLFLIAYLPSSNFIPMGKLPGGGLKTGAHHLYLAQAGLALLAGSALFLPARWLADRGSPHRGRLISGSLAVILMLLLCRQTFAFSGRFRSADLFYRGVLERNPVYAGAWQNYGWHKLYLDRRADDAERILLDGLERMVSEGDTRGQRKLVWNLLHLYLASGRVQEACTLLQCVRGAWLEDPVGNDHFWTLVEAAENGEEGPNSTWNGE